MKVKNSIEDIQKEINLTKCVLIQLINLTMSDRFQDKYRIPSARLRNWDYGWNGHYFITICSVGHDPYFGVIENKNMVLSEIGILVRSEWDKSFVLRPGLYCDNYVIMPNHIHAILRIDKDDFVETHSCASLNHDNGHLHPETHGCASQMT
jgi:hypothetical protein